MYLAFQKTKFNHIGIQSILIPNCERRTLIHPISIHIKFHIKFYLRGNCNSKTQETFLKRKYESITIVAIATASFRYILLLLQLDVVDM